MSLLMDDLLPGYHVRQSSQMPRNTISAVPTSKPCTASGGTVNAGKSTSHVADLAALPAHEVVMGRLDVGIEPHHPRAEIEGLDLPQLGELVQGLIDGLERDRLHLPARDLVDGLGGRVGDVALEHTEDALALGRHLAPGGAKQLRQVLWALHRREFITNDCCLTTLVKMVRVVA